MIRHLHIVCLDVPWPADYGGAIDMMNRIIMMKKLGIAVHLHYFSYNDRGRPNELNQYCESVNVYERKTGSKGLSARIPYIVASRINDELIQNLQKDDYPVLLEGIHTTGLLPQLDPAKRKIVVRVHNDESIYYRELARSEPSLIKKFFFRRESTLIRNYQLSLPHYCTYLCITAADMQTLKEEYHLPHVDHIPPCLSWQEIRSEEGIGNLCLYHANLSVPENEEAAIWLLRKVFTRIRKPFVIAGKKPTRRLEKIAHLCQHTCLVADPTESELNDLVRKAQINILPVFNENITGIRLKLLHALYEGRHCLVNTQMVKGTGLEGACHIAANAEGFASVIAQLYNRPFTGEEIILRKRLLGETFNNEKNTRRLIQYLW